MGAPDQAVVEVVDTRGVRDRIRHLGLSLGVSGVVLLAASAVAWFASGLLGAAGAALGVLLVVVSYTLSTLAIAWADSVNPRLVFPVGMGMYVTKFSLFGVMMVAIGGTDWPGRIPMAMGIVAAVVGWTGCQIWWTTHHEHPYVGHADGSPWVRE